MMKLQVACMILILVITSAKTSCSFPDPTANPAGLLRQEMEPKEETQGLQVLLQPSKRHNSHFTICSYCCKVCRDQRRWDRCYRMCCHAPRGSDKPEPSSARGCCHLQPRPASNPTATQPGPPGSGPA
ncbi:hepcidin-like [Dermochelys coriacea]|uniref:hepcidin-like n=1 Tax=Dermochelys coriacea TaxID=27794 RepID=UPI0018E70F8A|nr:hepcidin-like [Dermochelys coriacea]